MRENQLLCTKLKILLLLKVFEYLNLNIFAYLNNIKFSFKIRNFSENNKILILSTAS